MKTSVVFSPASVGFFTRLVVRFLRWCDWSEASFASEFATIPLDRDNDLLLKLHQTSPSQNRGRIQVVHLIEAEIEALRELWYNRLCFKCFVACPCKSVPCAQHCSKDCQEQACLHFLPLDECLHRKVVYCDYRRVQTEFVRRHFPYATVHGMRGYSYTDKELSRFVEEASPGVALLRDWRESNGATRYCIDVLISCLQQMGRQDVAKLIQDEMEPESLAPPVFISYQWDAQEVVLNIRQHLEFSGFPCWMDVGQVGGGDSLYGKIYEGISRAKVVLCCLTPRYASSSTCARELSLADVLRKPIVPVMVEPTPWPPPGPMAVVLSALVYVDLCGQLARRERCFVREVCVQTKLVALYAFIGLGWPTYSEHCMGDGISQHSHDGTSICVAVSVRTEKKWNASITRPVVERQDKTLGEVLECSWVVG
ncbi:hypothetical protein HPB48_008324 [Haemaphysalis longicornis]|uniref:TIR domain-containing protein n=1 Tax=Haemaphysalis longicornis TaxID=44386 RepID=A0A9J6FVA6_HAELO|nr:hypothetical protein HPB48_008324 [Haemaphysalis longicornis]